MQLHYHTNLNLSFGDLTRSEGLPARFHDENFKNSEFDANMKKASQIGLGIYDHNNNVYEAFTFAGIGVSDEWFQAHKILMNYKWDKVLLATAQFVFSPEGFEITTRYGDNCDQGRKKCILF